MRDQEKLTYIRDQEELTYVFAPFWRWVIMLGSGIFVATLSGEAFGGWALGLLAYGLATAEVELRPD